ncbi:RNA-dependent RNA polymerase [Caerostris extrusa]|uniref:RNA-dependent RNA polymerase n=1 Tax=Caerostris extrusa TaxID=172846 RepID=A0AAV4PWS8_CAEEX|nr:RNA-dependent RNA polymerase [Caerostris extrusa]
MLPNLNSAANFTLRSLYFGCDPLIIERAISILTKWGDEERIISSTNAKGPFLHYKTFLKLIMHVAELEGFVSTKPGLPEKYHATTAELCVSFFKYCMKLRFRSKAEVQKILPFQVYNDRILAKIALHCFSQHSCYRYIPNSLQ